MIRLTKEQISKKVKFVHEYVEQDTPADASKMDANANVTKTNVVTLDSELFKDFKIQINRALIYERIEKEFDKELAEQYLKDLESHLIYTMDESSLYPYCVSISMYPFLLDGMKIFGNEDASEEPTHLRSFCGAYVNLVQYVASQFAGAVATTEFLMYLDYFARLDFGDNYLETHKDVIHQELQGVVYLLNQDSAARGGQAVFSNISTFDKYFFEGIFGDFLFPDATKPNWESLDKLQKFWHIWFREERTKKLLTFPIVTHCAIGNEDLTDWKDKDSKDFIANEMALGGEFFIYSSPTADSLASCCRLRNAVSENEFSYSLGAGGLMTGSMNVITANINRMVQTGVKLEDLIDRIQKYQYAFYKHYKWFLEKEMLPIYTSGLIELEKQFLTIGVNGLLESAEFLGYDIDVNQPYMNYIKSTLNSIKELNTQAKAQYGIKFNTEIVPAENLGVKNAMWDKKDGLKVNRDIYNSYFYRVEDELPLVDKLTLHGGEILDNLDGGSAVHWNSDERKTKDQYSKVLTSLIITGSNYFCENVKKTCCNACGCISPNTYDKCPKCGSTDIDYATRIIGYLKKIKNFSKGRREEEARRDY